MSEQIVTVTPERAGAQFLPLNTVNQLGTVKRRGFTLAYVSNAGIKNGFYNYYPESEPITPNGETIFAAEDGGYWVKSDNSSNSPYKKLGILKTDVMYSWMAPKITVHKDGITYIGHSDQRGRILISQFNHKSQTVETSIMMKMRADDHHSAAIIVRDDAPPVLFVHSRYPETGAKVIYFRRAKKVGSITELGPLERIEHSWGWNHMTSYVQPFVHGSDILIFNRIGLDIYQHRYGTWPIPEEPTWTDTGGPWLSDLDHVDPIMRPYMYPKQDKNNPDILHVMLYTIPGEVNGYEHIDYCRITISTGDVDDGSGNIIGNLKTGVGLPVSPRDLTRVYTTPAGYRCTGYDMSADGVVITFSTFATAELPNTFTNSYYFYSKRSGSTWTTHQVVNTGKYFLVNYFGGMTTDYADSNIIYLSRHDDSTDEWILEKRTTENGGATWEVKEIKRAKHVIGRPNAIETPHPDIPIVWWEADRYNSFTDFRADLWSEMTYPSLREDIVYDPPSYQIDGIASPQDWSPIQTVITYSTRPYFDISFPDTHVFFSLLLEGPRVVALGDLVMQLLDMNGDPITSGYHYFVERAVAGTAGKTEESSDSASYILLAKNVEATGPNRRPRGRIDFYGVSDKSVVMPTVQFRINHFQTPAGVNKMNESIGSAFFNSTTKVGGVRLYSLAGNIVELTYLLVGQHSYESAV